MLREEIAGKIVKDAFKAEGTGKDRPTFDLFSNNEVGNMRIALDDLVAACWPCCQANDAQTVPA